MQNALIIVDVLNDFITGSLAVPEAKEIIPVIKNMIPDYDYVVFVQDWHPTCHKSFKSNGGLWPEHCVKDTFGAEIHSDLIEYVKTNIDRNIIQKGTDEFKESYSGFYDEQDGSNGLLELLENKGITNVTIVGLATDYCIKATAIDAVPNFEKTIIYLPACKFVDNTEEHIKDIYKELLDEGVILINDSTLLKIISSI